MKLLPAALEAQLPPLYSQEAVADPPVLAKYFTPWGGWTWYVLEAGRAEGDVTFFGLVDGMEEELGYFTLSDLESVRGPGGLRIERDLHWSPKPLSEVRR